MRITAVCVLLLGFATGIVAQETSPPLIDSPETARRQQEQWAQKLGRPAQWTNSVGMKFQLIPPGRFVMGNGSDADAPKRAVHITKPFYLGTHEVTRAQWEAVMKTKHSEYFPGADQPINYITWYHAQAFFTALNKLEERKEQGYRLPTEAQWEYAARAGAATEFPTGDTETDLDRAGWHLGNAGDTTHPVGGKAPNAFGLYDMHGNVWEWCEDFYAADYYRYGPAQDPTGPELSLYRYRVLRGGSIYFPARAARASNRAYYQDSRSEKHIGIRALLPIVVD